MTAQSGSVKITGEKVENWVEAWMRVSNSSATLGGKHKKTAPCLAVVVFGGRHVGMCETDPQWVR